MYKLITVREAGDDIGVDFDLEVNGVVQHFAVNTEAIEDLLETRDKLHGTELTKGFHKVAYRICEVAARKHRQPSNARLLLTTSDF
ncbi:hypothetical protein [Paraburkholderia aromaticivorans]|uniref:hypothetical protein n=1 Tax=Paraburkholderia aromaticivorans TaxID=2026199 RepID=UPI001455FFF7|nr:hypothetical protein [Paraburkholderia aromaticivorans]